MEGNIGATTNRELAVLVAIRWLNVSWAQKQLLVVFIVCKLFFKTRHHIGFLEAIILYRIREEDIGIDWEEKVCQRESGKLQGLLAQTDDVLEPRDI